ncbi:MAG: hypothetical protein SPH32_07550 [Erysipelotrichaceae bacterium]|nr:hypothetical protein [Erysipelotrichaceae bacterium]
MKKILMSLLVLVIVSGCAKAPTEETPTTTTPVIETTPSTTTTVETINTPITTEITNSAENDESSNITISEGGFKSVNVAGLFDVQVKDPLPEQMTLEIIDSNDPDGNQEGAINLVVHSSDSNCTDKSICQAIIYSFAWYTDAARENDLKLVDTAKDENFIQDYETSIGHIGVYRNYSAQISSVINDGNGPDYYYDEAGGQLTYKVEDLIRFDK